MNESTLADSAIYLQRLGFDAPPPPTLDSLRELQRRHASTFAFESLSTLLRLPVPIDLPSLERKILHEGRGGYCFELNRLYLALLRQLGFEARGITARVLLGRPEDAWTARTHFLALVSIDGVAFISDVGFGGMTPTAPLRLDTEAAQPTPHEPYRVLPQRDGFLLRAQVAGEWRALYHFDLQQQGEIDLEIGNWYVSTHPRSPFVGALMASRTGDGFRLALDGGSLAVHRMGLPSERRRIADVDAFVTVLQDDFGIRLTGLPELRPALARLLEEPAR
jgi:N-hydroxyarylamine O-acetyltransferase